MFYLLLTPLLLFALSIQCTQLPQNDKRPKVQLITKDYSLEDESQLESYPDGSLSNGNGVEIVHQKDHNPIVSIGTSKRLTTHLLAHHDNRAPPDGVVDVHYEMDLVHILGIDELRQTMTALVYVDEKWEDPTLAWNASDFEGMTKTWLPIENIWIPDIIIFNMLAHEDLLTSVRAPVTIYSNGTVEISRPAVYTVSCEINIKHFPLDEQRCALEIASWSYDIHKIRMHAIISYSLQHYTDNEEWKLTNILVKEGEYDHEGIAISRIIYEVHVRRKPLFYMVTLTFPSYIMCAISVVGLFARFSTTGEREERFTLGVTAILTMAVLSLVVSEKVPHSSTSVPLLVIYFLFNMVTVSVAAMSTGLSMKVHRMGRFGREPPDWMLALFLLTPKTHMLYECKCSSTKDLLPNTHSSDSKSSRTPFLDRLPHCNNHFTDGYECMHESELNIRRQHLNGYVRMASRLDSLLCTSFLVTVTVPVLILFYMMDRN